jgi:hypothetical protein
MGASKHCEHFRCAGVFLSIVSGNLNVITYFRQWQYAILQRSLNFTVDIDLKALSFLSDRIEAKKELLANVDCVYHLKWISLSGGGNNYCNQLPQSLIYLHYLPTLFQSSQPHTETSYSRQYTFLFSTTIRNLHVLYFGSMMGSVHEN